MKCGPLQKQLLEFVLDKESPESWKNWRTPEDGNILHYFLEENKGDDDDAQLNTLEVIKFIVNKEPKLINQPDEREVIPFLSAIINTKTEAALYLIDKATPDQLRRETNDYTPLAIAAGNGMFKVVERLLQAGVDPNQLTGEDEDIIALEMALHSESSSGHIDFKATVDILAPTVDDTDRLSMEKNPFINCVEQGSDMLIPVLARRLPDHETFLIRSDDFEDHHETSIGYVLRCSCDIENILEEIDESDLEKMLNAEINADIQPLLSYALNYYYETYTTKIFELLLEKTIIHQKLYERLGSAIETFWITVHPRALFDYCLHGILEPEKLLELAEAEGYPENPLEVRDFEIQYWAIVHISHYFLAKIPRPLLSMLQTSIPSEESRTEKFRPYLSEDMNEILSSYQYGRFKPRTLEILSRNALRRHLMKTCSLPLRQSVKRLHLPKTLHDKTLFIGVNISSFDFDFINQGIINLGGKSDFQ